MQNNLKDVLEVLENDKFFYEIFKYCPYEVLKNVRLKRYPEGQFYLEQGEIYDNFYLIVEGTVDIIVESEQGKKYCLTSYGKGRFIGELEIMGKRPYMSSVAGRGPLTTLEIDRSNYVKWLAKDSNFSQYVLRLLCEVTYVSMQKMGNNTLYTLKQRICQFLLENTNDNGELKRTVNAEILSERMGVTIRSVNRILKELKDKKILETNKSVIIIKDYQLLLEERNL